MSASLDTVGRNTAAALYLAVVFKLDADLCLSIFANRHARPRQAILGMNLPGVTERNLATAASIEFDEDAVQAYASLVDQFGLISSWLYCQK